MTKHRKTIEIETDELCCKGCGKKAKFKTVGGLLICSSHVAKCEVVRKKNSASVKKAHKNNPNMNKHIKKGVMNGWNKKSVQEKKEIRAQSTETLRQRFKDGTLKPQINIHTDETKQRLSEIRTEFLEQNHNHSIKWYDVNGIKVQGLWEKEFALRLNHLGIKWNRTKLYYDGHRRYTPDFFLIDFNMYVEIKGFMRERDKRKMWKVLNEHDIDLRIVESLDEIKTFENINFNVFREKYPFESIDYSQFKDIWV